LPAITVNDVSVAEGDVGTATAAFTVTLGAASGRTVTVDYATANGTATAPADYASETGTVTFTAGDTSEQVTIDVASDFLDEVDETFVVNLTNPSNSTISDAQGTGTITDDDTADIDVQETGGNTTVVDLVGQGDTDEVGIALMAQPINPVVLTLSSADPTEFTVGGLGASTQITFDSNNWDQPQSVSVFGFPDGTPDGNRQVLLTISVDDALSDDTFDSVPDRTVTVNVMDPP
jgi:hypothetical protein